ncbi:MAG TPA: glycosyltransferase family 2 protein [Chloroflexia bacterium]|nr:glycosyltransferase family 2 protein [Chloroflexia bacterium]
MDVSAIIVNYNGGPLLQRCLAALPQAAGALSLETIVVDNASTDGSVDALPARLAPTCLIQAKRNLGFARANNLGLHQARGRYCLLINTDCFLAPDSLRVLCRHLDDNPSLAVAGPRLLNADGSLQRSCHDFPRPLVLLWEQGGLWQRRPRPPLARAPLLIATDHDRPRKVDWVSGACWLARTAALRAVGGFDPRFFFYWEEADLCYRLRAAGWTVGFEPAATATHLGGASSSPALLDTFFRSLYRFYGKHYGPGRLALARTIVLAMVLIKATRAGWRALRYPAERLQAEAEMRFWLRAGLV